MGWKHHFYSFVTLFQWFQCACMTIYTVFHFVMSLGGNKFLHTFLLECNPLSNPAHYSAEGHRCECANSVWVFVSVGGLFLYTDGY